MAQGPQRRSSTRWSPRPLGRAMDTAQSRRKRAPRPGRSSRALRRHHRALLRHLRRGSHTTRYPPTSGIRARTWSPSEEKEASALQERMVDTLTNLMGSEGIETLLAVSHGSASRQFIRGRSPRGLRAPNKTPQLRHHDLSISMRQSYKQKASQCKCKFALQQIVDPQQSH